MRLIVVESFTYSPSGGIEDLERYGMVLDEYYSIDEHDGVTIARLKRHRHDVYPEIMFPTRGMAKVISFQDELGDTPSDTILIEPDKGVIVEKGVWHELWIRDETLWLPLYLVVLKPKPSAEI